MKTIVKVLGGILLLCFCSCDLMLSEPSPDFYQGQPPGQVGNSSNVSNSSTSNKPNRKSYNIELHPLTKECNSYERLTLSIISEQNIKTFERNVETKNGKATIIIRDFIPNGVYTMKLHLPNSHNTLRSQKLYVDNSATDDNDIYFPYQNCETGNSKKQ
ncbi:hypothetical protein MY04_0787 [Flammeovirga sp. MY04]|uniref:hypothetical protein n=1 Tax=Flammeovirga sp. MY04 TaxID=1191459 RepID=UPI0013052B8D|nr:hypothetical protein [Flammeovirga sp. MY04]ANQ48169.2 hypothetical protein MY04_0787 [Flammeovirga sp. MY04]